MNAACILINVILVAAAAPWARAGGNLSAKDKELCAARWPEDDGCLQARGYYNDLMEAWSIDDVSDHPDGYDKYLTLQEAQRSALKQRVLFVKYARKRISGAPGGRSPNVQDEEFCAARWPKDRGCLEARGFYNGVMAAQSAAAAPEAPKGHRKYLTKDQREAILSRHEELLLRYAKESAASGGASGLAPRDEEICAGMGTKEKRCLAARSYFNDILSAESFADSPNAPEGYQDFLTPEELKRADAKERELAFKAARQRRQGAQ